MTTTEVGIGYKAREHEWAEALRQPGRIQTEGKLAVTDSDGEVCEQCCLDVVCELAGLRWEVKPIHNGPPQVRRLSDADKWGDSSIGDLPKQAQVWLGVNVADPSIDFRDGLYTQGCVEDCYVHDGDCDEYAGGHIRDYMNAVNLNDEWHFTFPQIADLVDYFGLVRP